MFQLVPFENSKPINYGKSCIKPILCRNASGSYSQSLKFHSHKQQESLHHNQTNQTNYFNSPTINLQTYFHLHISIY